MPRTGTNIYKRKDGRWEGRYIKGYCEGGKAKYGYAFAKTYGEVKSKMDAAKGNSITEATKTASNITFLDLTHKWLVQIKFKVKASTYATYLNTIETHILPDIGGYKLKLLTSGTLDKFTEQKLMIGRVDGNGGLSPKTVTSILGIINSILEFGEIEKHIIKDSVTVSYPKQESKDMRVLSKVE